MGVEARHQKRRRRLPVLVRTQVLVQVHGQVHDREDADHEEESRQVGEHEEPGDVAVEQPAEAEGAHSHRQSAR